MFFIYASFVSSFCQINFPRQWVLRSSNIKTPKSDPCQYISMSLSLSPPHLFICTFTSQVFFLVFFFTILFRYANSVARRRIAEHECRVEVKHLLTFHYLPVFARLNKKSHTVFLEMFIFISLILAASQNCTLSMQALCKYAHTALPLITTQPLKCSSNLQNHLFRPILSGPS